MLDSPTDIEPIEPEANAGLNDSSQIDTGGVIFGYSQELDISLTPETGLEIDETADEPEEISMDLGNLSLEEAEPEEKEAAES